MLDVVFLFFIVMGVFVLVFIVFLFIVILEFYLRKVGYEKEKFFYSFWNFCYIVLGVIGIFVYVGIEIGILGILNFYFVDLMEKGVGLFVNGVVIGGVIVVIYWLFMLVGCFVSSVISGKVVICI